MHVAFGLPFWMGIAILFSFLLAGHEGIGLLILLAVLQRILVKWICSDEAEESLQKRIVGRVSLGETDKSGVGLDLQAKGGLSSRS